ncbi:hypothetical protein N7509_002030 [Penicillium cosmopolitanum]|uniref:Uncharacterized protein n=1 Tax=Penicillium cosmopolitanum TaxID=1131564 RepID=A0A9X0BCX8_9EURO|nr:uncharacterized protein N7509_002030 [Penicillium cosmopolitanum]KAJ5408147.1 hypothetical protein N7509_002030 [Penicillium cosmopolitanum]
MNRPVLARPLPATKGYAIEFKPIFLLLEWCRNLRDLAPDSKDERVSPSNGSSPADMAVPFATETYLRGSLDNIPMLVEAWTF